MKTELKKDSITILIAEDNPTDVRHPRSALEPAQASKPVVSDAFTECCAPAKKFP